MTRICLTGASGFAGHHFLEHVLTTTDWEVAATASFRHRGTCDRIEPVLRGPERDANSTHAESGPTNHGYGNSHRGLAAW